MKVTWNISKADIAYVMQIIDAQKNNPFVQERTRRNLASHKPPVRREKFWQELVGCLLSTQQRSGPTSHISRFCNTTPYPLPYEQCSNHKNLQGFVTRKLSKFGGIRRAPTIGREIAENMKRLENGLWPLALMELNKLNGSSNRDTEVEVANFIDDKFVGFGPKQARNLLQCLGLTRYEIPIDSRISKWLVEFGFPISTSAAALADAGYYHFVSTAIVQLCERCKIYPCIFDAAVFSSFD